MAHIIGGIGSSHAPSIAQAWDKGQQAVPLWAPLFDGYVPVKRWLDAQRPDLMVIIYNDHMSRFFFDAYPTFALGVADSFPQADEGWGRRDLPDLPGDSAFGWHLARSLIEDEFDPTICQDMAIDHGIYSVLPMLTDARWPAPVVPIAVNVIQHPLPTARRLFRLGQAIRRAVETLPQDHRVVVIGTGGLSHQLHGERFGLVDPAWDNGFLDLLESDPESLAALSHHEYMLRGGAESVEMILWLAMRAALGGKVKRVHRNYHAPLITGYGLLALES
ncbi:MAG TPA: class III extradiol dioxygenase family protein [Acetobacteraceae bacterium]|nr:class III extradiol dioxygenase family protein [Acetobacteraceae bacterium]